MNGLTTSACSPCVYRNEACSVGGVRLVCVRCGNSAGGSARVVPTPKQVVMNGLSMKALIIATLLCLGATQAYADDPTQPEPTPEWVGDPEVPGPQPVVPLMAGEVAPKSGLLVPEELYIRWANLHVRNVELEGSLDAKDYAITQLELKLAEKLEQRETKGWWERNDFWIGMGLGTAGTVALTIWAASVLKSEE